MNSIYIFLVVILNVTLGALGQDLTPGAKGETVVNDVVKKIKNSGIFKEDYGFLKRIAYVESQFGNHPNTYRSGYNGGIWQVDNIGFLDTKDTKSHPSLTNIHKEIKSKLGVDWANAKWEDLLKPLYSGIGARLVLAVKPKAIPSSLTEQGKYWKDYYNSAAGKGTAERFVAEVKAFEKL